jgi:hypothetical protein
MLKIYTDAACTAQLLATQGFAGTGAQTSFPLTNFTGAQLGIVYLETQVSHAAITFAAGVGSGFVGLTVDALIGQRVIHNGSYVGTVTGNTATTVTVSIIPDFDHGAAFTAIISTYVKKILTTDYSVAGNDLIMVVAPTATQNVIAVPTATLNMNFGGVAGVVKSTATSVWLKQTEGYIYDTLQAQSQDLSQVQASTAQSGITLAGGTAEGFVGLVPGALIGRALNHKGVFIGIVIANTETSADMYNAATDAVAGEAIVYTIGSLQFALDNDGTPGTYAPVVHPQAVDGNPESVRLWVKDTVTIPTTAVNYPNNVIKVTGIEYLV